MDNEQIQEDMEEQFEEMTYTLECGRCGKGITENLLATDFNRLLLLTGPQSYQSDMEAHNMTHYVKPTA